MSVRYQDGEKKLTNAFLLLCFSMTMPICHAPLFCPSQSDSNNSATTVKWWSLKGLSPGHGYGQQL